MTRLSLVQIVNKLNGYLRLDPLAMGHLADLRIDCGPLHIARPRIKVHESFYGRPLMGFIELFNTLFDDDQQIVAVKVSGKLRKFYLTSATKIQKLKRDKTAKRAPTARHTRRA